MKSFLILNPLFLCLFGFWFNLQTPDLESLELSQQESTISVSTTNESLSLSCYPPSSLYTVNITQTSATWDWSSVPDAVSYSVQWRYAGGTWYNLPGGPWTNTWLNVGGLQPGTAYEWRVKSHCYNGETSAWSYPASFVTLGSSCSTPTGLYTTNITESSATFSWSAVPGASSYSVQTRLPNGTWYYVPGSPFYNTSVTVYGLNPATTYQWRVRANCGYGNESYWSYHVTFTTLGSTACYAPSSLYTANITQTSATWDWSPVSGAVSYSIQWRYAGGTWYNLAGGPWTNTWINVGGLQPGTAYEWRVKSNCYSGQMSEWSYGASFTTLGYSCSTPTGLYTTNITGSSATLNWSAVSGATSYSVQTRLPNGAWYYVPGSPFNSTWVNIQGLNPGTTYEWRVRANCGYGNQSYWSYPVSFTTSGSSECVAPDWLGTFNITQTSATLDWSSVSGASSYSIQWRYAGGTWYNLPGGPWTNTSLTIGGLQPGTAYEWRVRSNCYYAHSEWSYSASFTTLGNTCSTPTGLYTTNITETSATFNWSAVPGATSYSVQLRLPNGGWYSISGSPFNSTWATAYGLLPGTTYEWRVRANCGYGQYSYWSYPISFTTLGSSSCEAPSSLYTFNITHTSATWDWSPVSGAASYSIQWRYAGGTWYNLYGGPWTGTLVNVGGLQPGTAYEWRVKANCYNGQMSEWSNGASFTTLGYSCTVPTGLFTTYITETSATFNWSAVSGAVNYSVQTRLPNGTWYYITGSPFNGTSATAYGLNPGTTYEWRVRANCGSGQYSNWSYPISFTTLGSTSCNAPSTLSTYNISQTTATWDWSPVSGASSYSVQWRYAGGTWYNLPGGPWTGTLLNIGGLQPGTAYEWRVKSNCYNGQMSEWSYAASFTTLSSSCSTPTGLYTSNITETSATFNWTAVPGAQNYSVQTRVPNGAWYYLPGSPFANTSVTATGLNPGTTYEWRVRANCSYGNQSYWSSPVSFTTLGSGSSDNDHCVDATVLTVGNSCVYSAGSNISATASSPAPVGGCPAYGYKDVWFRFTMPNVMNPTVTIRTTAGSLTDAVMEVYVGTDCSSLSYLTCEDDNTNGNGSDMPVINLIGYPDAMIWVRVWGHSGSTGTFSICVFDYQSNDLTGDDEILIPVAGEQLRQLENAPEVVLDTDDPDAVPSLIVAPNPASDVLYVTYSQTEESSVSGIVLTDISGKMVLSKEYQSENLSEFKEELDVSELLPGMYVLQVITTTGILSEKVSVVHQ